MVQIVTHIGMAKCLSSALQTAWDRAENYQIFRPTSLIEQIDLIVSDNDGEWQALGEIVSNQQLNRERFEQLAGDVVVLSSENMTTSFTMQASASPSWIRSKHRAMASLFGACSDSILLLVRDPLSWTTSMYYQHIKQGGTLAFNEYVDRTVANLLANLDIRELLSCFGSLHKNLVILPLELAKGGEAAFWEEYEHRLGVPLPIPCELPTDSVNANVTRAQSIPTHRGLNATLQSIEDALSRPDFADKSGVLAALAHTKDWAIRRAMSLASEQELEEIEGSIGLSDPSLKTHDVSELSAALMQCFLDPLKESPLFPYTAVLEQYEVNLRSGSVLVY
jgi:hypothetical protein